MKINVFAFILASLFAVAQCAAQKTAALPVIRNANIDQKSRNEIKLLNDKLIASLYEGNMQKLTALYSKQLFDKTAGKTETFVKTVHPIFDSKHYSLFDEYLYRSSAIGSIGKVSKGAPGDNDYNLNFKIYNKETYISLLVYPGSNDKTLVTAIYSKYGQHWELDFIHVGLFEILEKNAVDLYKQAKKNFAEGDLIDAAVNFRLAQQISSPAEHTFEYVKLPEMKDFGTKFFQQIRTKFPLPVKMAGVSTAPQMFDIEPAVLSDGIYPVISYVSVISLQNMPALTQENEQVKKAIAKMSPGINKNKKQAFFNVYNQMPGANVQAGSYRFVWKIQ